MKALICRNILTKAGMRMDKRNFLKILQSVDAFFPVGAFTLSNGLEDYVLRERIGSEEDLGEYLNSFLQTFPYQDLGIMSLAYRNAGNREYLAVLDAVAAAVKGAKEIRLGSIRMCSRYVKAREAMGDCTGELRWYKEQIKEKKLLGFMPAALGLYAAELGFPQEEALTMYGYSSLSAIVNNAVKLVPLSQMAGQRVLFESLERLEHAVNQAVAVELSDIGISGTAYEVHCMNHEHLYSRQYMS